MKIFKTKRIFFYLIVSYLLLVPFACSAGFFLKAINIIMKILKNRKIFFYFFLTCFLFYPFSYSIVFSQNRQFGGGILPIMTNDISTGTCMVKGSASKPARAMYPVMCVFTGKYYNTIRIVKLFFQYDNPIVFYCLRLSKKTLANFDTIRI